MRLPLQIDTLEALISSINPESFLFQVIFYPDLIQSLQASFTNYSKPQTILVKGEEDLGVLPAILLSPLNTAIFYGQPQKGLVYIKVTETSKQKALKLLQKLT